MSAVLQTQTRALPAASAATAALASSISPAHLRECFSAARRSDALYLIGHGPHQARAVAELHQAALRVAA